MPAPILMTSAMRKRLGLDCRHRCWGCYNQGRLSVVWALKTALEQGAYLSAADLLRFCAYTEDRVKDSTGPSGGAYRR